MALTRLADQPAATVVTLDARRAQLRRRRRLHAIREWAGLAAITAIGVWLASLVLLALLGH
jgi:hypothetical protein